MSMDHKTNGMSQGLELSSDCLRTRLFSPDEVLNRQEVALGGISMGFAFENRY